jgi:prepilin-type N-terminal cleavage/methylation domain-containing protein/prepilin-type processing-associated H-X9-DG protein
MRQRHSLAVGFTLVEVLVVIAIIGTLVALLLPAVQMAREAARRNQCMNNLKQIGVAVQTYHDSQRQFPLGRDRVDEYGTSWAFRLLPFLEEEPIFKSHVDGQAAQAPANEKAMRTPVSTYYCPSRRNPAADRDFTAGFGPSPLQGAAAGGDYAANAGSQSVLYGADADSNPVPRIDPAVAGPIHTYSHINAQRVTDGLSKTIAVGERYVPPPQDVPPALVQVQQGDTAFFSSDLAPTIFGTSKDGFPTGKDDPSNEKFGSEHSGMSQFVMLDGHVQPIRQDLDLVVFQRLTSIGDGEIISDDLL